MDNQLLAAMLMNQPRQKSPMAMFMQNFQAGMRPPATGAMAGTPTAGIWQDIGDFLNGRARKKTMADVKGADGDLKSWASPAPEETSSLGLGGYL